jgi:putative endonuclease
MEENMSNRYWTYVILLKNDKKYVGHTNNLNRRLAEHQTGLSPYTRKFGFKRLLYSKQFDSRMAAIRHEKFLKSGQGRKWLKYHLAEQSASGG